MKRFLFAAALVALVASVGTADEKPTAPAPAPVVVTTAGTPVAEYTPAQTQRRGLFGRLRNRNTTTTTSAAPVMTAPAPAGATPMPPITAPQPMPGTKTGATAAMGQIVQASGNLPAGTYTTTDGTIIQIGGTQMATDSSMSSQSSRRGLFSRLRSR